MYVKLKGGLGMDFNKATNAISYALTAITLYDP